MGPRDSPPLALLTCREFVTPLHVSLNGLDEVDEEELQRRLDREDANRKMDDNEAAELEEYVYHFQRICNPRLPFFLQDESEDEFAEVAHRAGKRRVAPGFDDAAAAELAGRKKKAKTMRETARRNVEKRVALNKKSYDKRHAGRVAPEAPGSRILLRNGQFSVRMGGKLAYRYSGPYDVTSVRGATVTFQRNGKKSVANIKEVKPHVDRAASRRPNCGKEGSAGGPCEKRTKRNVQKSQKK